MNFNSKHIKLNSSLSFKYSNQLKDLEQDWMQVNCENVYLSPSYLKALENSNLSNVSYLYVVVYDKKMPKAILYYQKIQVADTFFHQAKFPKEINSKIVIKLLKNQKGNLLLCGNFFATGAHGFYSSAINITPSVVLKVTNEICKDIKNSTNATPIKLVMYKEFEVHQYAVLQKKLASSAKKFQIDVNMVLNINNNWTSFNEYLNAMTTKYRTRAKSVLKKTKQLQVLYFEKEEIKQYQKEIEKLFSSVLKIAAFNMLELKSTSFYEFKKQMGDQFVFTAYFLDNTMVGFSTACVNVNYVDANYVGINYEVNKELPLYQKILYDFVQLTIDKKIGELRLGRTAETIKSALGAVPKDMNLYVKHVNSLMHFTFSPLLNYVSPSDFELRKPFKK